MAQATAEDMHLKDLLKQAIVEVLEERRDLLRDAFEDVLEDMALNKAIQEGEATDPVSRDDVFEVLEASQ